LGTKSPPPPASAPPPPPVKPDVPIPPCCVFCEFGPPSDRGEPPKGKWAIRAARHQWNKQQHKRVKDRDQESCCFVCPQDEVDLTSSSSSSSTGAAGPSSPSPTRPTSFLEDDATADATVFLEQKTLFVDRRPLKKAKRKACCSSCPSQFWVRSGRDEQTGPFAGTYPVSDQPPAAASVASSTGGSGSGTGGSSGSSPSSPSSPVTQAANQVNNAVNQAAGQVNQVIGQVQQQAQQTVNNLVGGIFG